MPAALAGVLARPGAVQQPCDAGPVDRFVRDWNEACAAAGVTVRRVAGWTGENPYKGRRPFEESDTADFFGRDQLVAVIEERLKSQPFVAVVGPSGSGKSSLVRAGVVPRLRAGGWSVATMRPGNGPASHWRPHPATNHVTKHHCRNHPTLRPNISSGLAGMGAFRSGGAQDR